VLAGCWRLERGHRVTEEWWMPPAGDALMGMARTTQGDRTGEFELSRIVRKADGSIVYEAHPSGQPETLFLLRTWEGRRAVFENPAHDFPQRVIYDLSQPDRLDARVQGEQDGRAMGFDYPYHRVACVPDNGGLPTSTPTP
jgi:hypothetical protein